MSGARPTAFHCAFRAQALRTPDRLAVVCGDRALTYRALDRRSDALASALAARGIGVEGAVGILLERSLDWATAVLGILKSGAAYVPLDTAWPSARVAAVAGDADLAAVVSDGAGAAPPSWLPVVPASSAHGPLDAFASPAESDAASLAYVIYTSGSTGVPKGVMVEHRSVANLSSALRRAVYADLPAEALRVGLNGPLAFDTSVKQLLQLAWGHTLVVLEDALRRDSSALAAFLDTCGLDVLDCTPSQLDAWIEDGRPRLPSTLLVGGEAIPPAQWQYLRDRHQGRAHNLYGPTECTVDALTCPVAPPREEPRLGRPLDGVRVLVQDAVGAEAAAGRTGEIAIAGAGLARGYRGRAGATAERFVPHPAPAAAGERIYLSGDRGAVLPDGEIAFLGRGDRQVKLRGVRIELDEVEAALLRHPSVRAGVVVPRTTAAGPALVAYVVSDVAPGAPRSFARGVRTFLRSVLPEAMVPAYVVRLDALPTTPNGKIDAAALPDPALTTERSAGDAPATSTERAVARAFCEVLGRDSVGRHESLFDLAAHSLLVGRIAARLRDALGREVPLRWFFESATVSALGARLDGAVDAPALAPVVRAGRSSGPVSFAQERVLFLHAFAPDNVAYLCRSALTFDGRLDVDALGRTLSAIVERHEILRTAFVEEAGRWRQEVRPAAPVLLTAVDVPDQAAPEDGWRNVLYQLCRERFDLARPPLVRWTLVRRGPDRHVLVCVAHHLVHDGWSSSVFFGELCAFYSAIARGGRAELPPMPVQMTDFCVWQRAPRADAAAQLEYWRGRLADLPAGLELPLDRPRPPQSRFRGAVLRQEVGPDLAARLLATGSACGATLFMTMLAAFARLVARQTGRDEVCIGSFVANRRRREVEPLIGMILNTLALRLRVGGRPDVRALVAHVRGELLDAYANQDVPFDAVVDAVAPERTPGRNPLFQVAFTSHTPPGDLAVPGARLSLEDFIDNGSSKFDLNVVMIPRAGGVCLVWEYDSDLFDADTVRALADAYEDVLATFADGPSVSIVRLAGPTAREERAIARWNRTDAPLPAETVDVLFDRQALLTPDAVAVVGRDAARTFADLRRGSERLAAHLRARGVAPGAVVGVCLGRSTRLPEALLAVLKAGAAYLPLDLDHPEARIRGVLRDASVALVLVDETTGPRLAGCGIERLDLAAERDAIDRRRPLPLRDRARHGDVAYVIYTSGSTGLPKGVAVPHGALVNVLASVSSLVGIGPSTRLFAVSNVSFDIAALELFAPLVAGGTCWLASEHLGGSTTALRELEAADPTLVQATPSGWRILLEHRLDASRLDALVGGEALPPAVAASLVARAAAVWNVYGPTETTIWSTAGRVDAGHRPSIGRPIANTRAHVLDAGQQALPPGAVGELVLAGAGVAIGYVGRGQATASAFVPDPQADGARMYRTGDLVRQRADGTLDFLGRRDQQVKIRGHRIELEEIEAALAAQPEVQAAVVLARADGEGDARLVAYLVPRDGHAPLGTRAMRERLRTTLPESMVPSVAVTLERLPLTRNGKVDRAALPPPPEREPDAPSTPPRTRLEEALASIWCDVLGRASVSVHDDFFGLGGHSLAAMQMAARASEALGFEVPLHVVFERPVLGELARALEAGEGGRPTLSLSALARELGFDGGGEPGPVPGDAR